MLRRRIGKRAEWAEEEAKWRAEEEARRKKVVRQIRIIVKIHIIVAIIIIIIIIQSRKNDQDQGSQKKEAIFEGMVRGICDLIVCFYMWKLHPHLFLHPGSLPTYMVSPSCQHSLT